MPEAVAIDTNFILSILIKRDNSSDRDFLKIEELETIYGDA